MEYIPMSLHTPYLLPQYMYKTIPAMRNSSEIIVNMLKFFVSIFIISCFTFFKLYYIILYMGWGHWDLNPDRRVSSQVIAPVIHHFFRWPIFNHSLTGAHNDAGLHHAPRWLIIYFLRLLLFSRLILFFRHFQRILCFFFQTLELRFIFRFSL